ncbi:hypothetical protein D018_4998A, partial [Vibrio parahaemolyticus VP2007-007]
MGTNANHG